MNRTVIHLKNGDFTLKDDDMDNKQVIREALENCGYGYDCPAAMEEREFHISTIRRLRRNAHVALKALEHLTDTAALVERLEGMKKRLPEAGSYSFEAYNSMFLDATIHNACIEAIIKELRENT